MRVCMCPCVRVCVWLVVLAYNWVFVSKKCSLSTSLAENIMECIVILIDSRTTDWVWSTWHVVVVHVRQWVSMPITTCAIGMASKRWAVGASNGCTFTQTPTRGNGVYYVWTVKCVMCVKCRVWRGEALYFMLQKEGTALVLWGTRKTLIGKTVLKQEVTHFK